MCIAASARGGPKRCPSEALTSAVNAHAHVAVLQRQLDRITDELHAAAAVDVRPTTDPSGENDSISGLHSEPAIAHDLASDPSRPSPGRGTEPVDDTDLTAIRHAGLAPASGGGPFDYPVIDHRDGDLVAWGFHDSDDPYALALSGAAELAASNEFVLEQLSSAERDAFTMYTDGEFIDINAAYTGREPDPETYIEEWRTDLDSAFAKLRDRSHAMNPVTVIRGTAIPPGYSGDLNEFLAVTYPVGAPVQLTKVTSFSAEPTVARSFTARKTGGYLMVARTREGITLRSVSVCPEEDEVVIGPKSVMRTVRVDRTGISGMPTVYLVSEELINAENDAPT